MQCILWLALLADIQVRMCIVFDNGGLLLTLIYKGAFIKIKEFIESLLSHKK